MKQHQKGIAPFILPLTIIGLLFATAGTYFILGNHATTPTNLQAGTIKGVANKCLDNFHNRAANANTIQLYRCNNSDAQRWTVEANGTITNANGYCLDVAGGPNATAKAAVHLHTCTGSDAQQWSVNYATRTIVHRHTNLCLDDKWRVSTDSNPIWLYQCNGTPAQKWSVSGQQPKPTTGNRWIMTSDHISLLLSQDPQSADWFFNTPQAFSMGGTVPGLTATTVKGYKSYAQFAADIKVGSLPPTTKWVMYDNESWADTPSNESQHPAQFMKAFADLAHQHGLKVIEAPARDLMHVPGADCAVQKAEPQETAYIRCGIAADARYADIYEIQAQALQPSVSMYQNFISQAVAQVRAKAPNITIIAGLTTDRGDASAQLYACWQATHTNVAGYWMNTTTQSFPVAQNVFDTIRNANQH